MLGQTTPTTRLEIAIGWLALAALGAGTWWASTIKDPPTARKGIVGNARHRTAGSFTASQRPDREQSWHIFKFIVTSPEMDRRCERVVVDMAVRGHLLGIQGKKKLLLSVVSAAVRKRGERASQATRDDAAGRLGRYLHDPSWESLDSFKPNRSGRIHR